MNSYTLFINNLVAELSRGIKAAQYANNPVFWYSEEDSSIAYNRIDEAADRLTVWTEKWCVAGQH